MEGTWSCFFPVSKTQSEFVLRCTCNVTIKKTETPNIFCLPLQVALPPFQGGKGENSIWTRLFTFSRPSAKWRPLFKLLDCHLPRGLVFFSFSGQKLLLLFCIASVFMLLTCINDVGKTDKNSCRAHLQQRGNTAAMRSAGKVNNRAWFCFCFHV